MTSTTTGLLPAGFEDLEPFAEVWALPSLNERHAKRVSSTMPELQAFYDAVVPRLEDAISHLDTYPVDDLPEAETRLFWTLCSLSLISFAVDVFKQPKVIDSGDGDIPAVLEPGP
jgi:hypothetical protein